MLDILFFLVITVFLFIKLKNILGKEDENTDKIKTQSQYISKTKFKNVTNSLKNATSPSSQDAKIKEQKAISLEESINANLALIDESLHKDYRELSSLNPTGFFDVKSFINGAEILFSELIKARSEKSLQPLVNELSQDLFKQLSKILDEEKLNNSNQKIDLVRISKIEIQSIKTDSKSESEIKIYIASEQVRYTLNGETVESGSISIPSNFEDTLVFRRLIKNKVYFWILKSIE